jgi:hypothetical protein
MNHIDEHTLELFILHAESVEGQRVEIEAHLAECRGCKDLADEIASFHAELKDEMAKPRNAITRPEKALTKRNEHIAPFHDLFGTPMPYIPQTRAQKLTRFVFRHPVMSGAGVLSLAAGLALLFNVATKETAKKEITDRNPAYVFMNQEKSFFEVMNRENEFLWQRPCLQLSDFNKLEDFLGNKYYAVTDRDGNGLNEVLTTLALDGDPPIPKKGIHILDGAGKLIDSVVFREYPSFRGKPYIVPNEIHPGALIIDTLKNNRLNEIYIEAGGDHSPIVLLRIDKNGTVLGQYWHFGSLVTMYSQDIDNDGNNELILCGENDVDDEKMYSNPVIIVLNPKELIGKQESSCSRGFGHPASTAEEMYIRLPQSDLSPALIANTRVILMRQDNGILLFSCGIEKDNQGYDFEYSFTPDLKPIEVRSTTWTTAMYNKLYKEGKIRHLINQAYLDSLKAGIRYWDGKEWSKERVTINHDVIARK